MELIAATYNVLADRYVRASYYPRVDPAALEPAGRAARLGERLRRLGAHLLCLQEVEQGAFARIEATLGPLGYRGELSLKRGRGEGCALFARAPASIDRIDARWFDDGAPPSGHVAQLALLRCGAAPLLVVNTHLRWHAPDARDRERIGEVQAAQLLDAIDAIAGPAASALACGDFNATPDSSLLSLFSARGFADPHPAQAATCNSNGRAKKIDYLLCRGPIEVAPHPTAPVADDTPLPSMDEPSDHVPLIATVRCPA